MTYLIVRKYSTFIVKHDLTLKSLLFDVHILIYLGPVLQNITVS
jgi:hypothetical protein